MNRLMDKLVKASGGWENFLYQTLKDVVDKVGTNGFTGDGEVSINDAQEVLEAYEETEPTLIPSDQVRKVIGDVGAVEREVKPTTDGLAKPAQPDKFELHKSKAESGEIIHFEPASRPEPSRRKLTGRVSVDSEVGASQGGLPMPVDHEIVDRQCLIITAVDGSELGRGSADGQVRGERVSGHIAISGRYRLAFKNVNQGVGIVHFEVVPLPSKITKKQFEEGVATRNDLTVENLRVGLQELGMVFAVCGCGKKDCFGWRIVDEAEIEQAEAERKARIAAIRNEKTMG